jgi:hypothetical protein
MGNSAGYLTHQSGIVPEVNVHLGPNIMAFMELGMDLKQ